MRHDGDDLAAEHALVQLECLPAIAAEGQVGIQFHSDLLSNGLVIVVGYCIPACRLGQ
jgi:hypothetical protein